MSIQKFRVLLYLPPIFEPTFSLVSKQKKESLTLNCYDAAGRVMIAPRGGFFLHIRH